MTPYDVHLVAYDVLEAALTAGTIETAIEPMRLELEVLSRDDLIRAMAIAAESTLALTLRVDRPKLAERLGRRRPIAMMAGS